MVLRGVQHRVALGVAWRLTPSPAGRSPAGLTVGEFAGAGEEVVAFGGGEGALGGLAVGGAGLGEQAGALLEMGADGEEAVVVDREG